MLVKTVKVTDKGQISIPISIREEADIEVGDELIILEDKGKVLLQKPEVLLKDEFNDLLKHSESVAKKLWSHKEDDVWDTI